MKARFLLRLLLACALGAGAGAHAAEPAERLAWREQARTLEVGEGVARDTDAAIALYCRAAMAGDVFSAIFKGTHDLELRHGDFGAFLRGSYWYDYVLRDREQPFKNVVDNNRKRSAKSAGAELLDAFVYAKGSVGELPGSIRIGKHALQYGESLFFGQNGIANAQGPVDVAKIVSVPNWQFKEVLLPVEQISGTLQVSESVTLGGYYQLKWRPSKIPGVGSYFSNQDYIGGGQVFFGPPLPPVLVTDNSKDQRPGDSGQFGGQLRWSPAGSDYEFGFYAARYHDKTPAVPVFDLVIVTASNELQAQGYRWQGAGCQKVTP